MTQLFKKIKQADAARKAKELDATEDDKIAIVEIAAKKISSVIVPELANAKLHTTTRRFVERVSKLQDALFFALERVLEVKTYDHYLKREHLEKLRNTKYSIKDINEILEKFNTGLLVYYASIDEKKNGGKQEKILISQIQEIVATYLYIVDNKAASQG